MNEDFRDILEALLRTGARFLVVGAHAMAVHGVPRATGDLDLWVSPEPSNADRVWAALASFGAPVGSLGVTRDDLERPGMVIQIGLPPRRIDLLTQLSGLEFERAWANRTTVSMASKDIPVLGRDDLIRNKRATGRTKDAADLEILEKPEE